MEPEGSLPHSHVPATCPYPEPALSRTSYFLVYLQELRTGDYISIRPRAREFSLRCPVRTGSGIHPAKYSVV
jgi:hypothetical protein